MQAAGYCISKEKEKTVRKKISAVCMFLGVLLICSAIALAVYNIREETRAADAAERVMPLLCKAIEESADENKPTDVSDSMTVVEIDGFGYIGYLSIPTLELELPVMSEWDYTRLKTAPCLYYGSVKSDNMVIAAHNYTRHFGRLSKLRPGDTVRFTDMQGTVYNYSVGDLETLPATATKEMITSSWELSLYTCTYGGGGRVTVRCERTDNK